MSSSPRLLACNSLRPSFRNHHHPHRDWNVCMRSSTRTVAAPFNSAHPMRNFAWIIHHSKRKLHFPVNSISTDDNTAYGISESLNTSSEPEGSEGRERSQHGASFSTSKILEQLKRYGTAGILSYGLLNAGYYLTTFLVVWFYFAPVPGKMGYLAAVTRFLKVMAMVWAGSQVTKLVRAAGVGSTGLSILAFYLAISQLLVAASYPLMVAGACALALAPFVDRGLAWFTLRFNFESRGKAFFTIVGFCLGLAVLVFLGVTLLWA